MKFKTKKISSFGLLIEPHANSQNLQTLEPSELLQLVGEHLIVVIRSFKTFDDSDAFTAFCERFGKISIWPFGKVLNLVEQENPTDHIFASSSVPLHWDGMYRSEVPEYQFFHCLKAPLDHQGGRTIFSNTIQAIANAPEEIRKLWSRATGTYERKMEFYHSRVSAPIVALHPYKNRTVIRYNEPALQSEEDFINPPDIKIEGLNEAETKLLHDSLRSALYAPDNCYAHQWMSGDIVIADNFSLLHGREKFTSRASRHLQRIHVLSNPPYQNPDLAVFR